MDRLRTSLTLAALLSVSGCTVVLDASGYSENFDPMYGGTMDGGTFDGGSLDGGATDAGSACAGVVCGSSAVCDDSGGSPLCLCLPGYQDNDGNGDCMADCSLTSCGSNSACDDSSGTALCACLPGFEDVGGSGTCTEIACPSASILLADDCGFEDGLLWPKKFNAVLSQNTAESHTGSASMMMEFEALPGQLNWNMESNCVPLEANTAYQFGSWVRHLAGPNVHHCLPQLRFYPDSPSCAGTSMLPPGASSGIDATWTKLSGSFTAGPSNGSARLVVACNQGGIGTQILVDDAFLFKE